MNNVFLTQELTPFKYPDAGTKRRERGKKAENQWSLSLPILDTCRVPRVCNLQPYPKRLYCSRQKKSLIVFKKSPHSRNSSRKKKQTQVKVEDQLDILTAMSHPVDDVTHGALLTDSLRKLQFQEQSSSSHSGSAPFPHLHPRETHVGDDPSTRGDIAEPVTINDSQSPSPNPIRVACHPHVRDGYGFRPASGISTPVIPSQPALGTSSPLPDPNGLGWPGEDR